MATALRRLRQGVVPPREIVLVGPRGNGKTALLRQFEAQASEEPPIDVLRVEPKGLGSPEALFRRLAYRDEAEASTERTVSGGGRLGFGGTAVGAGASRTETAEALAEFLSDTLLRRRKDRALAVVVDEAHTLKPEVAGLLLNVGQTVRGAGLPLQLVLAGTPGLKARLAEADATFWSRGAIIGVVLLDEKASREAISKPLEEAGIAIAEAALERAVADSQGYPFFLQLWGAALVEALEAGETALGERHAETAAEEVDEERESYYKERAEELERAKLTRAAYAAAAAFEGRESLPRPILNRTLAVTLGAPDEADPVSEVLAARDRLERLGFLWSPPDRKGLDYVPGIPSLMRYVTEHTPAPARSPTTSSG